MEILKSEQYINEKLDILPVTKDRLSKMKEELSVDVETRLFIEENNLVWNPVTMCYDCKGDIQVSEDIVINGKLKIRFGKVGGDFDCSGHNLTVLEGAPNGVGGHFYCTNNKLTTLEGAPKKVGRDFDCSYNSLISLEGAPNEVSGYFNCGYNELTSLEGAPKEVRGGFYCTRNKLTTLEGTPKKVGGHFDCTDNNLTTLEGAPQKVGGDFICYDNPNLVLPENKPSWVKWIIYK